MILNIEGAEATAKSTLALTAPLPIVCLSYDMGHKRAIWGSKFGEYFKDLKIEVVRYKAKETPPSYAGNDITVYAIPAPMQLDKEDLRGYQDIWDYTLSIFGRAVMDDKMVTVVLDTMTLLTKHKRDAYLEEANLRNPAQKRKQLTQIEYGRPDTELRSLYQMVASYEKNMVVIHHLRDHYGPVLKGDGKIEQGPDGTQEHDGVRDSPRFFDVSLRNENKEVTDITGAREKKIVSTFMKCGYNLSLQGMSITDATWDKIVRFIEDSPPGWNGPRFDRRNEA